MEDDEEIGPDDIRALIDEIGVERIVGDWDWNAQIWIPEYAEPILGEDLFQELEPRLAALSGIERLAWEDREVFLARLAKGTDWTALQAQVVDVVSGLVREAGHAVP